MPLPEPITALAAALGRLPGIGPRTAERLALHLAQSDTAAVRSLASAMVEARERVRICSLCGALAEKDPCAICDNPRRDSSVLCVVERPVDILNIDKSGSFHGKFHVLGGRISPLNGVEPEDLRIAQLESRLDGVKELILALSADVEGDATGAYLAKRLAGRVRVTRIAHGLPAGSGLEFADEITLARALEGRREV